MEKSLKGFFQSLTNLSQNNLHMPICTNSLVPLACTGHEEIFYNRSDGGQNPQAVHLKSSAEAAV